MKTFKDFLVDDNQVFFNAIELASPHNIDEKIINVVMDNDKLEDRKASSSDGVYDGEIMFHVVASEFDDKPVIGQIIRFDSDIYRVSNVSDSEGVYTITLAGHGS